VERQRGIETSAYSAALAKTRPRLLGDCPVSRLRSSRCTRGDFFLSTKKLGAARETVDHEELEVKVDEVVVEELAGLQSLKVGARHGDLVLGVSTQWVLEEFHRRRRIRVLDLFFQCKTNFASRHFPTSQSEKMERLAGLACPLRKRRALGAVGSGSEEGCGSSSSISIGLSSYRQNKGLSTKTVHKELSRD
jgi:hypothetical protein